jgi:hypothetical protein
MSLLKKFVATAPKSTVVEEIVTVTLMNIIGAAPAMVNDVPKERVRATVITGDGEVLQAYMFKEAVAGAPAYIPEAGLKARATLREVDGVDKAGKAAKYVNWVALGVEA